MNFAPGLTIDILWIAGPALIAGVMMLIDWWKSKKISLEMLLVLANVALIAFMPRFTWLDWIATLRLGIGLVIACLLYFALHGGRVGFLLSALWSSSIFYLLCLRSTWQQFDNYSLKDENPRSVVIEGGNG